MNHMTQKKEFDFFSFYLTLKSISMKLNLFKIISKNFPNILLLRKMHPHFPDS